jgi:hypothetical protein
LPQRVIIIQNCRCILEKSDIQMSNCYCCPFVHAWKFWCQNLSVHAAINAIVLNYPSLSQKHKSTIMLKHVSLFIYYIVNKILKIKNLYFQGCGRCIKITGNLRRYHRTCTISPSHSSEKFIILAIKSRGK